MLNWISHSQWILNYNNEYSSDKEYVIYRPLHLCCNFGLLDKEATKRFDSTAIAHSFNFNFVLHISPTTFFGDGSSGPLSLCPEVKYNQPFQNPTRVVFTRYGNFPITDHFCDIDNIENKLLDIELKHYKLFLVSIAYWQQIRWEKCMTNHKLWHKLLNRNTKA